MGSAGAGVGGKPTGQLIRSIFDKHAIDGVGDDPTQPDLHGATPIDPYVISNPDANPVGDDPTLELFLEKPRTGGRIHLHPGYRPHEAGHALRRDLG